ncbi:hypothetical protein LTR70_005757 [Exophiala xenobiotica]|uniref:Uncharacterized protein n=1 Tax=Lithohypha guttulata TaxID=1690604 RepID=A0ABR0K905_9EURO|nr:hypothetical protein LTR24_005494 [Lithohypha guttulata]KAK5317651.1 hypothetical protein LTR70_005757 [Exophiala xenobiotica]
MADDKNEPSPVLAPPVVILICIAGAVAVVIAAAAMYRLCRRANAGADDDVEGANWNPNKRNKEQDKYMEEVRWRNNAFAWERAKQEKRDRNVYRRGWFKEQLERQRAREQGGWTAGREISAEEFLTNADGNPYQELLGQRTGQSPRQSRLSPEKTLRVAGNDMPRVIPEHGVPETAVLPQFGHFQANNTGVRITVNDESNDIVGLELLSSNKFPPRNLRMFRSSSIYSGDALLPSNHLHMVQSSSNYALKETRASRVRQEIDDWEQRNQPQ